MADDSPTGRFSTDEIERIVAEAIFAGLNSPECDADLKGPPVNSRSYVSGEPYLDRFTMIDGRFFIPKMAAVLMTRLSSAGVLVQGL